MSTAIASPRIKPMVPQNEPASLLPKKLVRSRPLYDPEILGRAFRASFLKLNPITLMKNPVMFVVEIGAALTSFLLIRDLLMGGTGTGFSFQIALWLWFTVLFANFAEAMAEARGKAQADALRKTRTEALAKRLGPGASRRKFPAQPCEPGMWCSAKQET